MRDKVSGNHSTSSARILLSSELADDKFYDFTTKILGNMMRGDKYHSYIRNDPLLLSFGTIQMQMKETGRYQDISYTLRCIAKLNVEFKRISKQEDVTAIYLISRRNFENIVTSMKKLSGYESPRKIKTPHIALKLGFLLKNLADIATLDSLKKGLDTHVTECQKFVQLYEKKY